MLVNTAEHPANLSWEVARWENEGGAPSRVESLQNATWFVPPLVFPALIVAAMFARFAYLAYDF